VRVATDDMTLAELLEARTSEVRNMAAGGVEIVVKCKEKEEASRRGTCAYQWVGGGDGRRSAQGAIRENEVGRCGTPSPSTWHDPSTRYFALVIGLPTLTFTNTFAC